MQNMSIRIPDNWAHVGAFFQNLGHIAPLFQERGLSVGPDTEWWLPTLAHLAGKDMEHEGLSTLFDGASPDFFAFSTFSAFSFGLPATYQTVEEVYQGVDLDVSITSREDGTSREDFVLDGQTLAIRYTNLSADVAWAKVTNFYEDGDRTRKLTEYEDGSLREDTFVDGLRVKTIQQDDSIDGLAKLWFSIEATYNDNGQLLTRETEYDDGIVRNETFQDGQRTQVIQSDDVANVRDWVDITTLYEPNGDIAQRTTLYDNGMERADFYAFGTLTVVTKVDAPNTQEASAFNWSDIIQFHDDAGILVSRGTTYDDGTFRSEDFNNGVRTRIIENDLSNQHEWDMIERLFDETGALASRRLVEDSSDQTLMFYENGNRDIRVELDGDQSETWAFRVTTYDPVTSEDTSVMLFNDAAELPENYLTYFGQDSIM